MIKVYLKYGQLNQKIAVARWYKNNNNIDNNAFIVIQAKHAITFIDSPTTNSNSSSNNDCKPFMIKQEHARLPPRLISMNSPSHSYGESIIDDLPPLSSSASTSGCLNRYCCGCVDRAPGSSFVK